MTRDRWILVAAILGSGIVFLDSSIVVIAQRAYGQELPTTLFTLLEAQSYAYYGYLLTLSALLILAGGLSDFHGRARMFAAGLVGFAITSALCGLATSMEMLIVFRLLQGATGALLVPGSLSILTASFEGTARTRAFALWASASGITSIIGPFVGGLLVYYASWRLAFLINVPLIAIAMYATRKHVPESRDETASGRFDWLGAIVVALATGGLSFGVIRGQAQEWRDPGAFVALGVGVVCTVLFPIIEARSRNPLVPLGLFRSRNFAVTNLSTLLIYGALYVTFQYVALFVLGTLGYDEMGFTLGTLGSSVMLVLLSRRFGTLAERFGARRFLALGPALMALALLWLARVPAESAPWRFSTSPFPTFDYFRDVLPYSLLFGLGLAMLVAPLVTVLMASVPVARAGVGSAVNNAISRVGPQLVGAIVFVAITGSFYTSSAEVRARISPLNPPPADLPPSTVQAAREASTDAFRTAMIVSAAFLFAGAAVNALGISEPRRDERPEAAAEREPTVVG